MKRIAADDVAVVVQDRDGERVLTHQSYLGRAMKRFVQVNAAGVVVAMLEVYRSVWDDSVLVPDVLVDVTTDPSQPDQPHPEWDALLGAEFDLGTGKKKIKR